MKTIPFPGGLAVAALALVAGCQDLETPTELEAAGGMSALAAAPAPQPLVPVTIGETQLIWPYTDTNFDGTAQDPVNLVFAAQADPRNVRNALLSVQGSRSGPFAPFDCAWTDAIGGPQTAYADGPGWAGSVIQLECGSYTSVRFHVRLFPVGDWTLANAHVDVLIPGTTDHQVLSWELGEQLVAYDLSRSGYLAAAPGSVPNLNGGPTFGSIPPIIYNQLPAQLRALTGGPITGTVTSPVGIPTNGTATVVSLADAPEAGSRSQEFLVQFAQTIPTPFCAGVLGPLVRVDGPVRLSQTVRVSSSGVLVGETVAEGPLTVRPVDPATMVPGAPLSASTRDEAAPRSRSAISSFR